MPFAESFPGRKFLSWLPYIAKLSGQFGNGRVDGVYQTEALPIAPLICWESGFSDLAFAQIRRGAQLLVISTDDAWFGTTSGPYMHAQIAQLRAIETGAYTVRAAATGISGIINPDGSWQARSKMEERIVIYGKVGRRVDTVFLAHRSDGDRVGGVSVIRVADRFARQQAPQGLIACCSRYRLAIVAGLVFGAASFMVSALRWRGSFLSFLLGFLLGPIGLLIALGKAHAGLDSRNPTESPRVSRKLSCGVPTSFSASACSRG